MCLQVRLIRIFVCTESRCLNQILQYALHADIQVGFCQNTTLHLLYDILDLRVGTRFHQVVTSLNLCCRIAQACPVGHHDAVKAPFIAQNGCKQFAILLCKRTVDAVVRRHHRPRGCFANGYLKPFQVDFAEGTL